MIASLPSPVQEALTDRVCPAGLPIARHCTLTDEALAAEDLWRVAPTDRRGLRLVPCRAVAGQVCVSCGPDLEVLLERVRVIDLQGRVLA